MEQANTISLSAFLEEWAEPLGKRVMELIRPIHNPADPDAGDTAFRPKLDRINAFRAIRAKGNILPAQAEIIKAFAKVFFELHRKTGFVVGEMGTGKTLIGSAIPFMANQPLRCLVQCPPHLVFQWCAEIRESVPNAVVHNINGRDVISKLQQLNTRTRPKNPEYYVISRERAKNSYFWSEASLKRDVDSGARNFSFISQKDESGRVGREKTYTYLHCPRCGNRLIAKDDQEDIFPITQEELNRKKQFCRNTVGYRIFRERNGEAVMKYRRVPLRYKSSSEKETKVPIQCGSALWTATPRLRRYSPAEFIKRHMKGFFDVYIADEVHEAKGGGTLQGNAYGTLASCAKHVLNLTGTLSGGYADDIFYVLWRNDPERLKSDGFEYGKDHEWLSQYGVLEIVHYVDEEDTRSGKGKRSDKIIRKKPGISPLVTAKHLLDKAAFIRLSDMWELLPPYEEIVRPIRMLDEQKKAYSELEADLQSAVVPFGKGSSRLISKMLQVLLSYPDTCVVKAEEISRLNEDGEWVEVASAPKLTCPSLPKEDEIISIIQEERLQNRRVILFATFTDKRDILPRFQTVLERAGIRCAVLRSTVAPERRMGWINERTKEGVECLIVNPELVKTGLNLLDYPTFIYAQTGYNIFTLRQSSRRSWRIGQKQPVKVFFLPYKGTLQEESLRLIAKKLEISLMLEGELVEGGLSAINDSGNSLLQDLAKSLQQGIRGNAEEAWSKLRKRELLMIPPATIKAAEPQPEFKAPEIVIAPAPPSRLRLQIIRRNQKKATVTELETTIEDLEKTLSANDSAQKVDIQFLLF
jgi:hypothetical protein